MNAPRLCLAALAALLLGGCSSGPSYGQACGKLREKLHDPSVTQVECRAGSGSNSQYQHWLDVRVNVLTADQAKAHELERRAVAAVWQIPAEAEAVSVAVSAGSGVSTRLTSITIPLFDTNGNFSDLRAKALYNELKTQYGPHPTK